MLVSAHLSKWSSLPDFPGSLWQRQLFLSWLSLRFLDMSADNVLRQAGLPLGSVFGHGSSELGAGLVPSPSECVEWASWLPGFSGQAY